MVGQNQLTKPFVQNMSVDLCGCKVRMSKHGLDGAQISSSGQEMCRKGMAEAMWRYPVRRNAGLHGKVFQQGEEALPCEVACRAPGGEQEL